MLKEDEANDDPGGGRRRGDTSIAGNLTPYGLFPLSTPTTTLSLKEMDFGRERKQEELGFP